MRIFIIGLAVFACLPTSAQKGPGGVGNTDGLTVLHMWWRADTGVTPAAGPVSSWSDQSGYGNTLSQPTAANQPTVVAASAALNNKTIIHYNAANSQYFTSAFMGPGVDNLTVFLVANGTSYQSLFRWQDVSGTFVVYPWEGAGRVFISSSDGGTGTGVLTGIVNSVNNVAGARYHRNTATTGMQTYLNGGVNAQRSSVDSALPTQPFFSGRYNPGASEYPTCDVGEMMVFNAALNDAEMVIIQNYLAAKFNVTLTSNDVYTMDNNANGDFDSDVAGIGQVDASNIHNDSQGTGFVRILNPTDLGNGEYFMWGHNNLAAQANNSTDIPAGVGITARFDRVWRVSETGEVGNIDLQFDLTGLPDFSTLSSCDAAASVRLLVDTNNDGLFADQTPISGATNIGGNIYRFANIGAINNNYRFTLAIVSSSVGGPGGVGGTNGTTNLKLWMDATKGVATNAGAVTSWTDQSGNGVICTPPTVGSRPTFVSNVLNSQPVINFNSGSSNFLELSSNVNTVTPTTFIVANKATAGTGYMTILTLQQNLWLVQGSSLDQWGMYLITDVLSGVTLNTTFRTMTTLERNFNDVDFYTDESFINKTTGTGFHGKAIGTIGSNNNGTTNTGLQFFNGRIAEIAVFNKVLNSAERIIVDNYLAAKYGLALTANDVYTRDNPGNGNFDFEVAGIGQVNATNLHNDAKGTGIVRISSPTNLGDGEFLMWGDDNGTLVASTSDVPPTVQARFNRVWSVSEVGEVGNIDMQFDLTGQNPITASDLRLLIDDNGNGVFNEGTTIIISGAVALSCNNYLFSGVPAASLNNAMRFTLGTVNKSQTPLPIELLSFEGTMKNNVSELLWATATEHNNDYFTVERSEDGEKFSSILKVLGAGLSTVNRKYSAIDESPPSGKIYYRLKQTDYDGKFTYSKIILLTNLFSEARIVISPNPARIGNDIDVKIISSDAIENNSINFIFYDLMGKSLSLEFEKKDNNHFNIKTNSTMPAGMYILRVRSAGLNKELFQRIYLSQ